MTSLRRSIALVAVLVLSGCDQSRATEAPTQLPAPTPIGVTQAELESWIQFRHVYGLRADAGYVVTLAIDPRALDNPYGVPLLPGELESIASANTNAQALLPIAQNYADDYAEFAGAWLELPRVVLAFTGHASERRAEAAALFQDRVIVRDARFRLRELQHFVGSIQRDAAWFETLGAHLVDVGVDPMNNVVSVHIRFPDAAIERKVRDHFGDSGWMVFTYDGPPPWRGAFGNLDVTVVDPAGEPVAVECLIGSTDPRVQAEQLLDAPAGPCVFKNLAAVTWSLRIDVIDGEQQPVIRDYQISPGATVTDAITIGP